MAYIASNDNRFYAALETSYAQAAAVAAQGRIPALKLTARQRNEKIERKDKTGSRTFVGNPSGLRRTTNFDLKTYMAGWTDHSNPPPHGSLFQAALGGAPQAWGGGTAAAGSSVSRVAFSAPHGLQPGQGVNSGAELRFVSALVDDHTVQLAAPFSVAPAAGVALGGTMTYVPAAELPSATIFDYWSPGSAVQRILCGTAVDQLTVSVNGDFHEFTFSGYACDVLDSASFQSGQGGLSAFPAEPTVGGLNYSIIPGHMGQVWLGTAPDQFFTLTKADIVLKNELELRNKEFGSTLARGISPGMRVVTLDFHLYAMNDDATKGLYQAARQRSPVSVMMQLGEQPGQLFGVYLKSLIPEVPEFDDAERRLQWMFRENRAQGSVNDEIFFAFG
jgi:hypothetical protein